MIKDEIDIKFLEEKCNELGLKYKLYPERIVINSTYDEWFFKYNNTYKKKFTFQIEEMVEVEELILFIKKMEK